MKGILISVLIGIPLALALWQYLADKKFRKNIIEHKQRLDDLEYLRQLPLPLEGRDAQLALRFRAAFASLGNIPKECVSPDMLIIDLFSAQSFLLSDGLDYAELVMELEDELNVEIPEDAYGIQITDSDTVGTFTGELLKEQTKTLWNTVVLE